MDVKKPLAVAAVALAVAVGPAARVSRADNTTDVTFTIAAGGLSVEVADPETVALTHTAGASTVAGNLLATTVSDTRNSTVGWTVYAHSSDFTTGGGDQAGETIPASNVFIKIPTDQALSMTVQGTTQSLTSLSDPSSSVFLATNGTAGNATHGSNVAGGSLGTLQQSAFESLLGGLGGLLGGANHTLTFTPHVAITVPSGAATGAYAGTITHTVS